MLYSIYIYTQPSRERFTSFVLLQVTSGIFSRNRNETLYFQNVTFNNAHHIDKVQHHQPAIIQKVSLMWRHSNVTALYQCSTEYLLQPSLFGLDRVYNANNCPCYECRQQSYSINFIYSDLSKVTTQNHNDLESPEFSKGISDTASPLS